MQVWRFINDQHSLGNTMVEEYNLVLVICSFMVASLGAYTALAVVDRILATTQKWLKVTWLSSGATAFGFGVWAMHFIGMLAFSLSVEISYKLSLTLVSILPAVFGSGIALYVMSQKSIKWWHLQCGALLMALGIGTMHYIGMEAMQLNASMRYDFELFVLSILAAHVLASLALYIKFYSDKQTGRNGLLVRLGSAMAMGIAVSVMHYIAMAAAKFFPGALIKIDSVVLPSTELSVFVVIITTLIFGIAILGTIVDRRLTDASRSVRESENFARLLLESAGEGICGIGKDGEITFANPAAAAMLGFDVSELIGYCFNRISGDQICSVIQPWQSTYDEGSLNKNGEHSKCTTFIRQNGEVFSVEYTRTCIKENGTAVGCVLTFRDITERLQAETDLRESEKTFCQVIDHIGQLLWMCSAKGEKVLYLSPAYEQIWGRSSNELYDNPELWMQAIHPDDRKRVTHSFATNALQGLEYAEDYRIVRPDGELRWIHDHAFPIHDVNGKVKKIAGFAQDITESKNVEEERRLSQKLEAVGQLAAGIAHEINTPTQYVNDNTRFLQTCFSELIRVYRSFENLLHAANTHAVTEELISQTEALVAEVDLEYLIKEIPQSIDETLEGIQQISSIVKAMKDFSHPGGEDRELADINQIIQNTLTVSRNEWKYVAKIETDLAVDMPMFLCFPQLIGQVMLNLIVNASQAIKESLNENVEQMGTIKIITRFNRETIEILISDTGTGIKDSIREKIFDPFFTTKEVGIGTGQGLAFVRSAIIDRHFGSINVDSKIGLGTTFMIAISRICESTTDREEVA